MDALLFNFHDIVLIMTSYQCALFALLLLVIRRERRFSNTLLALFLFSQAAIPLDILINFGDGFRSWSIETSPDLFFVFGAAYWLEGPLLLWYTRSLTREGFRISRLDLWYLLPFLLAVVFEYFSYWQFDSETKTAMLRGENLTTGSMFDHLLGLARESLRVLFGVLCFFEVRRCRRQIRDNHSSIEKIDLTWLLVLIWGFLLVRIWAVMINLAVGLAQEWQFQLDIGAMGLFSNYAVFVLVSAMIFFSLSYSSMFEGERYKVEKFGENVDSDLEQDASGEPEVDLELAAQIENYMREEKPYLIPALTLEQLSGQLQVSRRLLSQTINRHFQCNFFEFVNRYRIDEAKRMLREPQNGGLTVMEIMLSSGFNTKATFNSFFKKIAGMTPTEYRRLNGEVEVGKEDRAIEPG
ncbi:AraC family transcriptional regulator [Microbulbifer sp. A4B17]|uniref:AraC family transcriptional regulator n=1 Tax=Microbulbifer sp. A4B17 TaxID=359370 RepID=UPI000D52AD70|nr:helix-turn-helix domain-containing protein [Microbulbifer sp. A4B17]AWF80474.1 AraC family transcriptional regulator [Microbulbifer sp. A4B17]